MTPEQAKERKPLAYIEAVVRFPVYEGDDLDGTFDWFEYRQPGVKDGDLAVCTRPCKTLSHKVVPA